MYEWEIPLYDRDFTFLEEEAAKKIVVHDKFLVVNVLVISHCFSLRILKLSSLCIDKIPLEYLYDCRTSLVASVIPFR